MKKENDRRAFLIRELPPETIKAIRESRMDPKHNHLDKLLEEKGDRDEPI